MKGRREEKKEGAERASGWEEEGGRGWNVEEGGQKESLHNYLHVHVMPEPTISTEIQLYYCECVMLLSTCSKTNHRPCPICCCFDNMQVSVNVCDSIMKVSACNCHSAIF